MLNWVAFIRGGLKQITGILKGVDVSSTHRIFDVLRLFTDEKPVWTVEEAMGPLSMSISTAYRYFRVLCEEGLLDPEVKAGYVLGPAFIEYDRRIRRSDPLLNAATPIMQRLVAQSDVKCKILLSRFYKEKVMCVHQETGEQKQTPLSYERGLPLPLFKGATSKIILAHLPARSLKRIYEQNTDGIAESGMGDSLKSFKDNLKKIKKKGVDVTYEELDPGLVGMAAPLITEERGVIGSLTLVFEKKDVTDRLIARIAPVIIGAAREIELVLSENETTGSEIAKAS